jgi:hypothetical protein
MTSDRNDQPTIDEIRKTFGAMIERLHISVEQIPDWLVRKAKFVQLKILLEHSKHMNDSDELTDFCLSSIVKMKCSIDGARFGLPGPLIDPVLEGLQNGDGVNLKSVIFAGLYNSDHPKC